MKGKQQNRTLAFLAVSMFFLLLITILLIFFYMNKNRDRITEQNRRYLEDATSQTVQHINKVFDNASTGVRMVSRLYELQLDSPVFDYHMLNDMAAPTPFDFVRFISPEGISWAGDGTTIDCSDREYFLEGIQGNSGVCYVAKSRFTNGPILIFYYPLYYEKDVIGVVSGVIDTKHFANQIDNTFFGKPAYPCVFLPDGTPIVSTLPEETVDSTIFTFDMVPEDQAAAVQEAFDADTPIGFLYSTPNGTGIACIAPLKGGDFTLVQTFSAQATDALIARANRDAMRLEIQLIAIFLLYIMLVIFYYLRRNRTLTREKVYLNQIVDSVKRLYRRFVVFDLANDSYEYLKEGDLASLDLPPTGFYTDWLEEFRRHHLENPEFWGPMDDMTVAHLQKTLTKEEWYAHREYRTPDGRWERLSLLKLDMDSDVTSRILGAVEDITDTKLRDEESRNAMEAAYRAAEAASRAKSDFLSRMSHDIRTPMNAIVGLTAIMGAHLDDRDRIVDCLTKITSSSKHLLGLINEVLDMSKIESGKFVLSEAEFSLSALIDDIIDIVQPTANAKHQEFSVQLQGLTNEDVIGDSLRFQQVCVNILSNAVKYTGEGGHIRMTITQRPSKQPSIGKYTFIFEDDGIGMSPEFLERIFTPFERAEDERVNRIQGTGLGMSIAQNIVRLMGGTISVESEVGKGSVFTVHISFKLQDIQITPVENLIGLPVLVADDEKLACETACLMLDELGMHSEWVLTGQEAVERVTLHHEHDEDFFAVILDWKMPGMDGLETAKEIRHAVGPDVPIIILSAYDWSEIEGEARAAGVNAFIAKPLFKSRLRSVFLNLISHGSDITDSPLTSISSKDYSGKHVLLAEDNELNQEIAKEILEMTGLSVDVAENGRVALERFQNSAIDEYDMVFMDIQMPVMNGLETTRAIRALEREDASRVPIIAMTANTFSDDVQASLDAGMNQHIGKPLDFNQLTAILEKWL